ncbi:MAG: lipoate--protein ligase [Bacteroidales bacterium]|nr:lipoate--protein ligase [Bacteroidales bacterium]
MTLQFLVSTQTNPYLNLAVENYLVGHSAPETATLYLWRNRRTVVIGQNQNPYAEVNLERLLADGGYLVRRRTGGGAVYHDDGNLNFSLVIPQADYNLDRQFAIICQAVELFGLRSMRSGRNDIMVDCTSLNQAPSSMQSHAADWRKFSGNAFHRGTTHHLHHGTLLISGNLADLKLYLQPKPSKLLKHGVQSVSSRVANLADLNPAISTESIAAPLCKAFAATYGQAPQPIAFADLAENPTVQKLASQLSSDEWLYRPWRNFTAQRSGSFSWGEVDLSFTIADGHIADVQIATDALDLDTLEQARLRLCGASTGCPPEATNPIESDLIALIYQ